MNFARTVWKILVAIKDGLVLLFLLLFFAALYAVLTLRPVPGQVREGALYVELDGPVVEERTRIDPAAILLSGEPPQREYRERDLVRAIEAAAGDARIKAVVLDLEQFAGGRQVHLSRIGSAMDKVRAAGKPVLVRALLYRDDTVQLAAHSSEAWIDPMGGAVVQGPGGSNLFFKGLLDRLKVTAHVFRVGTYKSAVEPFLRDSASPESKEALAAVYGALWDGWQDEVRKARPKANLAPMLSDPAGWIARSGGDAAKAALAAGIVDRIGDRAAFVRRVAEIAGKEGTYPEGGFRATGLAPYLADRPLSDEGKPIGVVTIANEIVDGDAGPGVAGGDRIADLIDSATENRNLAALVVRIDSPGGSVLASERIRAAIERAKARKIPVAVSMANLAASGGYWVATPADRIFAEPGTVTGSIGVFAVLPSFEGTLADYGVNADSVRTTPLSGQPDLLGGLDPQFSALAQAQVERFYGRFVGLVAASRRKTPAQIDAIAQGRVWDGGTARQIGLVDAFGDLDDALAWAAKAAGAQTWHPVFLGEEASPFDSLLEQMIESRAPATGARAGDLTSLAALHQRELAARMGQDLARLLGGTGAQAYCLECAAASQVGASRTEANRGWLALLKRLVD